MTTRPTAPEVYTVPELAKVLKIGRNAAYEVVRSGLIPGVRFGKNVRVPRASVERFLNAAGQRPADEAG